MTIPALSKKIPETKRFTKMCPGSNPGRFAHRGCLSAANGTACESVPSKSWPAEKKKNHISVLENK